MSKLTVNPVEAYVLIEICQAAQSNLQRIIDDTEVQEFRKTECRDNLKVVRRLVAEITNMAAYRQCQAFECNEEGYRNNRVEPLVHFKVK